MAPQKKKDRQYIGEKKRRTDNTMTKANEEQTIQWPKEKKNRQYNGQNKRTVNAMAKTKERQTIHWSKEKDRQCNGQRKKDKLQTMI